MIRLFIRDNPRTPFQFLNALVGPLHDRGIVMAKPGERPDVYILDPGSHGPTLSRVADRIRSAPDVRFILTETMDPSIAMVLPEFRALLELPNVYAVLKISSVNDLSLNNAPSYAGTLHWARVIEAAGQGHLVHPQLAELSASALSKIRAFYPVYAYPDFSWAERQMNSLPLDAPRSIDVMFGGTVDLVALSNKIGARLKPHHQTYQFHRRQALRAVMSIGGHRTILGLRNNVSLELYGELLKNTKIYVSGYGLGEQTLKDFHALMFGCVLIKPDCGYMHTYRPNIYDPETCVHCAVDFSDLKQIVETVLGDYETYRARSLQGRERILAAATGQEAVADDLARIIRDALNR